MNEQQSPNQHVNHEVSSASVQEISEEGIRRNIQTGIFYYWNGEEQTVETRSILPKELISLIGKSAVKLATVTPSGGPNIICTDGVEVVDTETREVLSEDTTTAGRHIGLLFSAIYMQQTLIDIAANPRVAVHVDDSMNKPGQPATELSGYKFLGIAEFHSEGEWLETVRTLEQNQEFAPIIKGGVVVSIGAIIPSH